mmetsp:Transcript_38278/g.58116  ORF Transcript_38278/g.58116 Transcript_38278/m.58116 type:complete len:88 (+) Transcript_38278:289-552(+)
MHNPGFSQFNCKKDLTSRGRSPLDGSLLTNAQEIVMHCCRKHIISKLKTACTGLDIFVRIGIVTPPPPAPAAAITNVDMMKVTIPML